MKSFKIINEINYTKFLNFYGIIYFIYRIIVYDFYLPILR